MPSFKSLLDHTYPEWPDEWRFRLSEVCNLIRIIEREHEVGNSNGQ